MRARELLEDYHQSLDSDLNNLLIAAKGNGLQEIQTHDIVKQLYNMGYSVNVNSIMELLSDNPVVMNATPEMINLTSPDGSAPEDEMSDQDADADVVRDKASKAAKKGLKDG